MSWLGTIDKPYLKCDMRKDCIAAVTHIDEKGYAYCKEHGKERKAVMHCRKITRGEMKTLLARQPIGY